MYVHKYVNTYVRASLTIPTTSSIQKEMYKCISWDVRTYRTVPTIFDGTSFMSTNFEKKL